MLYPVPAVLVSVADSAGNDNLITIAWTGTVCSDPAMTYISVRKERYSHHMLKENKEFVINLVSKEICRAADFCGVRSGRDLDKFAAAGLTTEAGETVSVPVIKGCGLHLECKIVEHYTMAEDKFDKELCEKWYANKDWHTCYTGIITAAYVEE